MEIRFVLSLVFLTQFCFYKPLLFGQTFPINQVLMNGELDKRVNMVFLSEGYTNSEISQFSQNVQTAINDLFNTTPYQQYNSYFNVFAIEVPSNEAGTDHPGNANDEPTGLETFEKDTYFQSTFDFAGIHRLLVPDHQISNTILQDNFPEWDIVFMLVNHSWYGGSGGTPTTSSLNSASSEIAIHELGHSFPFLADEYESPGLSPYEAPNTTAQASRDSIKWNAWIDTSTPIPTPETGTYSEVVGLFEGAVYRTTGWYRPKLNCKMRSLGVPFCEVCTEQTILSIYSLLNTIETYFPLQSTITLNASSTMNFHVQKMDPVPNTLKTEWHLNGQLTAINMDDFIFDASAFTTNEHQLQVVVTDTTEMVINDPNNWLSTTISWQITIDRSPLSVADNPEELPENFQLYQNFPNPFNPQTTIEFSVPSEIRVHIDIFNLNGQHINLILSEIKAPGRYSVLWDGTSQGGETVTSGIYVYRITAGSFVQIRKMVFMK